MDYRAIVERIMEIGRAKVPLGEQHESYAVAVAYPGGISGKGVTGDTRNARSHAGERGTNRQGVEG